MRRNRRNAQIRNVLLSVIGLGGLWFGVQKFGVLQKIVVKGDATATAATPQKQASNKNPQTWGTSESEVGYRDLLARNPHSPATVSETPFGSSAKPAGESGGGTDADSKTSHTVDGAVAMNQEDIFSDITLLLVGMDAGREQAKTQDTEILARTIEEGAWQSYQQLLTRSLKAALPSFRPGTGARLYEDYWKAPEFYTAFLRWQVIERIPGEDFHSVAHDSRARDMITWLLTTPEKMEEVLLTVKPSDDTSKMMGILKDTWIAKEDLAKKYFNLALACGVVFDKPMKTVNPGGNQPSSETQVDPLLRYVWYVEKNEESKLATSIDRFSARDLVYVVCAPVITSELNWAISKVRLNRKNWGNAYGMIEYLMERAVKGTDPYEAYTFEEILKEGGICGDQSYFCANTARANGIPAMTLGGETDLGGHAWVALKVSDDEWTTDVGRIGGVSKGQADNPQEGGSITEQDVWLLADRHHQSASTTLAVFRHLWLGEFFSATDNKPAAAEAARLANSLGRTFVETWSRLYAVLEDETKAAGDPSKPEIVSAWKAFATDMRREFKDNPRMASLAGSAEDEYVFPYASDDETRAAFLRERRRTERDSSEQKDLLAESLKRQADLLISKKDPDALVQIQRLYGPALRNYGGSITGFKMIIADYFGYMDDSPENSKKAARDIEMAYNRVVKTGSQNWFRTTTEGQIVAMIADYYRRAGDPARATLLEKRQERERYRAERGAL